MNMKDNLKMDNTTDKENILGAQEIVMKVSMKVVKNMDMEYTQVSTEQFIRDTGLKERGMGKEWRYQQQEQFKK